MPAPVRTKVGLWVFMTLVLAVPAMVGLSIGADKLDRWLPDGEGTYTAAWIRTRDLAPGDELAVRVVAQGALKAGIIAIHAKVGNATIDVASEGKIWAGTISSRAASDDESTIVVTVPDSAPLDRDLLVDLKVDMALALAADGGFHDQSWTDHIELPVSLRSPGARTMRRLVDRGQALLAWLVACALGYAGARFRRAAQLQDKLPGDRGSEELLARVLVLALIVGAIGMAIVGQLLFVRPLLRTLATDSTIVTRGLLVVWVLAPLAGVVLGLRARRQDLRWWRARLRTVIGTPPPTSSFYQPSTGLPPSLSREAPTAHVWRASW